MTVTWRATLAIALLAWTAGCGIPVERTPQPGTTEASPGPEIGGAYTFRIVADPDRSCGWPVTTFDWPVAVDVASYQEGTTVGSILFAPTVAHQPNRWGIRAGPAGTQLTPGPRGPGPVRGSYDLVVSGGSWDAGGPTLASGGRGEVTDGIARGASLVLVLAGSGQRWECGSDARWSLVARSWDQD